MIATPPWPLLERVVQAIHSEVAVAKNPDIWASMARGGDWDLVTEHPEQVRAKLVDVLGEPVLTNRRSYVVNTNWEWGHIDLLPDIRWRGVKLLDSTRILADATPVLGGLRVARAAHEAIASCLFSALAYGWINDRYSRVWIDALENDGAELERVMIDILGRAGVPSDTSFEELQRQASDLRRAAVREALRKDPAGTIGAYAYFTRREMAVRSGTMWRSRWA